MLGSIHMCACAGIRMHQCNVQIPNSPSHAHHTRTSHTPITHAITHAHHTRTCTNSEQPSRWRHLAAHLAPYSPNPRPLHTYIHTHTCMPPPPSPPSPLQHPHTCTDTHYALPPLLLRSYLPPRLQCAPDGPQDVPVAQAHRLIQRLPPAGIHPSRYACIIWQGVHG